MNFDFLIFDLDGTLIDSEADVSYALNRLLADYEIPPITRDVIRTHVGYGIQPLIKEALLARGVTDLEPALRTFTTYYLENCTRETELFADVVETLKQLEAYQKVVLTNKSTKFIGKILTALNIESYFVGAYGRESFAKMKPDPLPIRSILDIHGGQGHRALMIGDTETDIHAGQNAGIQTCLVTYGYGRRAALQELKPEFTIATFADLIPLLET